MEGVIVLFVLVIGLLITGALGSAVSGPSKKRLGFWLGALLGPIGVLIAAIACREP